MNCSVKTHLVQGPRQRPVSRLADEEEGSNEEQVVGEALVRTQQTKSLLLQNRGGDDAAAVSLSLSLSLSLSPPSLSLHQTSSLRASYRQAELGT